MAYFSHPDVVGTFYKVGNILYYDRTWHGGKRLRVSTGQTDLEAAAQWVRDRPFGSTVARKAIDLLPSFKNRLLQHARVSGKTRGIPFSLTKDELEAIWKRCEGYCEVSGLPFSLDFSEAHKRRPYAPSIDRRDSAKGYHAANCRLVCAAVNVAMNDFGEDILWEIACSMVMRRTKKPPRVTN